MCKRDYLWAISTAISTTPISGKETRCRRAKLLALIKLDVKSWKTIQARRWAQPNLKLFPVKSLAPKHPLTLPPPPPPRLTLPEFFQCLSNLSPATSPVSLSGILGLPALLSTRIQHVWPRIQPFTARSSPRKPSSYGLRWQLAFQSTAMATAWDLITQTHLVLWGFEMNGILAGL